MSAVGVLVELGLERVEPAGPWSLPAAVNKLLPDPAIPPAPTKTVVAGHLALGRNLRPDDFQAQRIEALRQHGRAGGQPAAEVTFSWPLVSWIADRPIVTRSLYGEGQARVSQVPHTLA